MYLHATITVGLWLLTVAVSAVPVAEAERQAPFRIVTAEEAWREMNPGWNLGNTLDAVPDEGSWNNPKVTEQTFDDIKASGFKSVRIPVTWTDHFDTQAPNYTVNAAWLDRVEQVVDWALKRNFYTVLNVHHDSWQWADYSQFLSPPNPALRNSTTAKLASLWTQIATRFSQKSHLLILEPLNEPAGSSSQEVANEYNILNQLFVDIVRSSGGYNKDRLLTLPGLNTNIQRTVDWWVEPKNVGNYILHVHDYDPWAFVSTSWGRTWWGSDADKKEIEDTFIALKNRFNNSPALIGEWGLTGWSVEKGASWRYFDFMVRTAREYKLATQLWDNGLDHFDRLARKWRDPVKVDILQNAVNGFPNILPKMDQEPTLWFVKGEEVMAGLEGGKSVKLDFNGNEIEKVYELGADGKKNYLRSGDDYQITQEGITFTQDLLESKLSASPTLLGPITTFYLTPSRGATLEITLTRYQTPTILPPLGPPPSNSTTPPIITITDTTQPYLIPLDWRGTHLATVQAIVRETGVPLKDDWTVWLGPLEQGRLNWGDFEERQGGVEITAQTLQTIKNAAADSKTVMLTVEFWPRIAGNNVTVWMRGE